MNRTRRWIHAALFTSLITAKVFAVEVNVNIKGCITDQKSKEPLIGATVQIVGSSIGAVTDMDGNFQLSGVEDGIYDIEIKYVGYIIRKTKCSGISEQNVPFPKRNVPL